MERVAIGLSAAAMVQEHERMERRNEAARQMRWRVRFAHMSSNVEYIAWLSARSPDEEPSDESFSLFRAVLKKEREKLRHQLRRGKFKAARLEERQGPSAALQETV